MLILAVVVVYAVWTNIGNCKSHIIFYTCKTITGSKNLTDFQKDYPGLTEQKTKDNKQSALYTVQA